jgi:chemotaxis methyl-accepting protein methylase
MLGGPIKVKLVVLSKPRPFSGNITHSNSTPDVVNGDSPSVADGASWFTKLIKLRLFRKSPTNLYLRLNRRLWNNLPASFIALPPIRSYGYFLHRLVQIQAVRGQLFHTFFLRNRPTLELIRRLVERRLTADPVKVAVLGCSTGAEVYSIAWSILSARPDLRLVLHAIDISKRAVEIGKSGVYSTVSSEFTGKDIFDRISEAEIEELFDSNGNVFTVKSWIKEGIEWHVGDAGKAEIVELLGPQDIVVANNFLCHMEPTAAERCLRNIAHLVRPNGYLFVSGIDLDIRTKVAKDLGWHPLQDLLEQIHNGDPRMGYDWPWNYSALEPLNRRRRDWRLRYAAAFRLSDEKAQPLEGDRSQRPY